MRRTVATVAVALILAATGTATSPSYAEEESPDLSPAITPAAPAALAEPQPAQLLERAEAALDGKVVGPHGPEATLALRDLFAALPRLSTAERAEARQILARPTNKAGPKGEVKYRAHAFRMCAEKVCVQRVKRTRHAATKKWAGKTLRVLQGVWRKEVGSMGYRRPFKDRGSGGNGKLDVYLANLGDRGLYGYCVPEFKVAGFKRVASAYCVLDNDFSRAEFGGKPIDTLKATAAHELFHTVQFAYDFKEDPWLMEASATWIEERYADGVNDNRQYLPFGQLVRTWVPLDTFRTTSLVQYGNWAFFEYLSQRFGAEVVRKIWRQAGHFTGDGKTYSTEALERALPDGTSFKEVFARYSAANLTPERSYPEGETWPGPKLVSRGSLGRGGRTNGTFEIDHMSTHDVRVTPKKGLDKKKYKLRVTVDGPGAAADPMATVVLQRPSGTISYLPVALNDQGEGARVVPFNRRQTARVWLVLSNASTRFKDCGEKYTYSCGGTPIDDQRRFGVKLRVVTPT
jgi:hypothetical protein